MKREEVEEEEGGSWEEGGEGIRSWKGCPGSVCRKGTLWSLVSTVAEPGRGS
jgi:hypothetical protein